MIRPTRRQLSLSRRGAVTALVAILMVGLLALMAFAIDLGYIALARTELQTAGDSAALAAASQLQSGVPAAYQAKSLQKAKEFAAYNRGGSQSVVLANSDVEFGTWDSVTKTFQVGQPALIPTAVRVRGHRDSSNQRGPLPLFFAGILGTNSANVDAETVAALMAVLQADVVPIALINNQSFGPVDPKVVARNPGKDGPSYATHPNPEDPKASFAIGDKVTVGIYGKGPKSPVHITLRVGDVNMNGSTQPADVQKILEGRNPAVPVKVGDEFLVFNEGTGGGGFLSALDDRVERYGTSDPIRTVIVPVVAITPTSRNEKGQLSGKVRVVDFVAVHLDEIEEVPVGGPGFSGNETIRRIVGTVVKTKIVPRGETRGPTDLIPETSVFALQLVR